MKHFEDKHPDKKDILIERLVNVYGEYLADMEKENA
jgi:hypothetical protein